MAGHPLTVALDSAGKCRHSFFAGICRQGYLYGGHPMDTGYKPTLRFDATETLRLTAAAEKAGLKPAEWMRKLILDHAPPLTLADPRAVRVDGFQERFGWNLIHHGDALTHADALRAGAAREIEGYVENYLTEKDGEIWIDGDKLPGVDAGDVDSVPAKAVDLCRAINRAHIRAELARTPNG
jgi:hypothetical protein